MKFGGLSEEEVKKIKAILEQEKISFEVGQDQEILQSNDTSMRNDLRHYRPPNISTHILGISIDDHDYQKLSASSKEKLMGFGITDLAPAPEEFLSYSERPAKRPVKFRMVHILMKAFIFGMLFIVGFLLLHKIFFPK